MTAPPKPWERSVGGIARDTLQREPFVSNRGAPATAVGPAFSNIGGLSSQTTTTAPRPPPRPTSSTVSRPGVLGYGGYGSYGGYGGYGSTGYSGFSPYGMRGYGSYGSPYSSHTMMNGYGGYGTGYGQMGYGQPFPHHHSLENRFIQAAEESSRPAFESLESMVHAFGSVSMMLESTFFAIHSSFRAVLGVAENFGRMRGLLAQVFSALTIFRTVRWAFIRLLQILRLRKPGEADKVWEDAAKSLGTAPAVGGLPEDLEKQKSAWPIVMFMSLVMGGPYLIWKLLRSVQTSMDSNSGSSEQGGGRTDEPWMNGQGPCYVGRAEYSFTARQSDELSFSAGDVLAMAPAQQQVWRNQGWMLATVVKDAAGNTLPKPRQIGLVPSNHFRSLYNRGQNTGHTGTGSNSMQQVMQNNIGINNVPVATFNQTDGTFPTYPQTVQNTTLESQIPIAEENNIGHIVPPIPSATTLATSVTAHTPAQPVVQPAVNNAPQTINLPETTTNLTTTSADLGVPLENNSILPVIAGGESTTE